MADKDDKLLNLNEVGERLHAGRTRVYQLINRGEIRRVKLGRSTRVLASDLQKFIERLVEVAA